MKTYAVMLIGIIALFFLFSQSALAQGDIKNIETTDNLLKFLNNADKKEYDGGIRVVHTYNLTKDLTIKASQLSNTYFQDPYAPTTWVLYSNFEGNGNTITIQVDTDTPARPLFNRINSHTGTTKEDRLFIKNLTVEYKGTDGKSGDVLGSPFIKGSAVLCDFENITIDVEGDIVADQLYLKVNEYNAYGFSSNIQSILQKDESNNIIKDEFKNNLMEPISIKNISVTAGTIGSVEGKTPESKDLILRVSGFTGNTPFFSVAENISLNFAEMNATNTNAERRNGSLLYGFAGSIQGEAENITISIEGDMIASSEANGHWTGAWLYGFADSAGYLKNSSLSIGGDMIAVCNGINPPRVSENALIIGISDVSSSTMKYFRVGNFINNSLTVQGNISATAPQWAQVYGGVSNPSSYPVNVVNTTIVVGNDMKSISEHSSEDYVYGATSLLVGMNYGVNNSKNNSLYVGGDMISKSQINSGTLVGHSYAGNGALAAFENNAVHVVGDIVSESPFRATAVGMFYQHSGGLPDSTVTDNIIRTDGQILAYSKNAEEDNVSYASGFSYNTVGIIKNNAVFAADGIHAKADIGSNYAAAGFSLGAVDSSVVSENTWLGKPGIETPVSGEKTACYEDFIYSQDEANTAGNFYTSVLEGQRVSNELIYDSAEEKYKLSSSEAQPLLVVESYVDYTIPVDYIVSADSALLPFSFGGIDAELTDLKDGQLDLPYDSMVSLISIENGKKVVKDLPGIGHHYEAGEITGSIFADKNGNGDKDLGEEVSGIVVRAYFDDVEVSASEPTDSDGIYKLTIPLFSAQDSEIVLKMDYPSDYEISDHPDNIFGVSNSFTTTYYWTKDQSLEPGILVGGSKPDAGKGGSGGGTGGGIIVEETENKPGIDPISEDDSGLRPPGSDSGPSGSDSLGPGISDSSGSAVSDSDGNSDFDELSINEWFVILLYVFSIIVFAVREYADNKQDEAESGLGN
ncbi:hypothetical protein LJC08_01140 [Methanimicrococcus sp. OttesenSCG-928-J09]|nr:hypothetical protein [Methanimicrococcus sp. OttesenSCG-928-J09]